MSFLDRLAISMLPAVPRSVMRRLAGRYIAGERLEEAIDKLSELAAEGFDGILDILGEHVESEERARQVAGSYREAARAVHAAGLDAYLSVKPTHVGLLVSPDLALELYDGLARDARELGSFVRVEMEDHPTVDATLDVFAKLRAEHENVGIVLQSRLFRTPDDVERRLPEPPVNVRMVKGIYLEPPEIAHVEPEPIRAAFLDLTRKLWERGDFVALATHDEELADGCFALAEELGKTTDDYEMQVLLGVRAPLWRRWREEGRPVRVYVPYGPEWRAYSQRRLRHNPQIFRHVVRDTLRLD